VKSLASLDANDALPTSRRRIGERLFTLANGVWTDARYVTTLKAVRVRPYSSAYFDLVKRLDGIASVFALGDRLVVAGRSVAIELAADGVERLTSSELDALARGW
jgi:hypothetical protein